MVCSECMKMCCLGGKNSVVKGLTIHIHTTQMMCVESVCVVTKLHYDTAVLTNFWVCVDLRDVVCMDVCGVMCLKIFERFYSPKDEREYGRR